MGVSVVGWMSAKKSQSLETFATLTIRYSVLTKYTKYSIFCSQWADLFAWNREFFRYSSGKPPWIEKIVYLVDFFETCVGFCSGKTFQHIWKLLRFKKHLFKIYNICKERIF